MPRKPDPIHRAELLNAAVDYAMAHGLAGLTLRPLAQALGVAPNTLVHHFGSKEDLIGAILNGVRDRLRTLRAQLSDEPDADPVLATWQWTAGAEHDAFFRSFFEAYGMALREPDRYASFLGRVVSDWIDAREPVAATLELAVQRGLLLDLLTTGDRERVEHALTRFRELSRPGRSGPGPGFDPGFDPAAGPAPPG